MTKTWLADEGCVLGAVAHIQAAKEILIVHGGDTSVFLGSEILEVGLDHGMHVAHLRQKQMFPLDDAIQNVIERGR